MRVISSVMTQGMIDLEAKVPAREVQNRVSHVSKEHLHGNLTQGTGRKSMKYKNEKVSADVQPQTIQWQSGNKARE